MKRWCTSSSCGGRLYCSTNDDAKSGVGNSGGSIADRSSGDRCSCNRAARAIVVWLLEQSTDGDVVSEAVVLIAKSYPEIQSLSPNRHTQSSCDRNW